MNLHAQSTSGGDGRRPPRDRKVLGVNDKGASKKSKRRQQRQNQPSHRSGTAGRGRPVFTAADLASENEIYDVMVDPNVMIDPMFFDEPVTPATAAADNTAAQAAAMQASASQALAMHAVAAQNAAAQFEVARGTAAQTEAARAAEASSAAEQPLEPAPAAESGSSGPSSRADASSSDLHIQCPHCPERCTSHENVQYHVRHFHDLEGVRHCSRCRFTSRDRYLFQAHISSHNPLRAARSRHDIHCPYCSKRYTVYKSLERHVRYAHDHGNTRHCFRCRFTAPDARSVQVHMRTAHARVCICFYCGKRCTSAELAEHERTCRG